MPSLIPGYEYDIFISYRQKDNKYDGWVTEFVDNLKRELEATFKDDISVYFDINPHDGLLETHNVNASLKEKLKCLVFIPIISQTYCDSKSFAWQNEFVAFNISAKEDQFGRDIRLAGGNVASRILPVKIHDLDTEDKALLENELGGVLRSIEFIYKSAGVNRPLRANEDHPQDNLNKTFYRDQINKVANAVKEIINAIKKRDQKSEIELREIDKIKPVKQRKLKSKYILVPILVLALLVIGYFITPLLFKSAEPVKKSIAVLPFKSLSADPEKQFEADGMMDAILTHLQKLNNLRVMPRISVEQYRETAKSSKVIGREQDVEYLLDGRFQKHGDEVKLIVNLINAGKEREIWTEEYTRNWKDIFSVQSEVAEDVARNLAAIITQEEKKLIEKRPSTSVTAYELYLKAEDNLNKFDETSDLKYSNDAITFLNAAIGIDSTFAEAYLALLNAQVSRNYWETFLDTNSWKEDLKLIDKALSFDDQLESAYSMKGYAYWNNGEIEESLKNFDKALKINPNYYEAYWGKGFVLTTYSYDFVKGINTYLKALPLIRGDQRPGFLRLLGRAFLDIGFTDKAKKYYQEAFDLDGSNGANLKALSYTEFCLENFEEATKLIRKRNEISSTFYLTNVDYTTPPETYFLLSDNEAYSQVLKMVDYYTKMNSLNGLIWYRIGYTYNKVGKFKEAEEAFNREIKNSEEAIKMNKENFQMVSANYNLAAVYAFKGDKEKAYKYLDEFSKRNFFHLWRIVLMKNDPMFAGIRNEAGFQRILQDMKAKNQAEHERVKKWLMENNML
jgi:TolB-like protein